MDKRITEFSELIQIASNDVFAIVDVSENITKKLNYQNLVNNITGSLPSGLGGSGLGWARYDDSQYTTATPLAISASQQVILPNNGNTTIETYMNSSVDFYNPSTQKVQMENVGDVYNMVVVFKAKSSNANQTHLELAMSSTGTTPYERVSESLLFAKGNDVWQNFYLNFSFYSDADFVTNGNTWKLSALGGPIDVADVIYFIQRTFNAG